MVDDATARFPVVGDVFNWVIQGFYNLFFGKSPSGFKKGGVDNRMKYYGSSMVGLMSKEMYNFYTGPYYKRLSAEAKGIIPFEWFSTLLLIGCNRGSNGVAFATSTLTTNYLLVTSHFSLHKIHRNVLVLLL